MHWLLRGRHLKGMVYRAPHSLNLPGTMMDAASGYYPCLYSLCRTDRRQLILAGTFLTILNYSLCGFSPSRITIPDGRELSLRKRSSDYAARGTWPYISMLRHASAIDTAEGDDRHHHPSPVERAMHLIKMERRDITVVAIYGVVIGLISLVTL